MKRRILALLLLPAMAFAAKFPKDVPTAMVRFTSNVPTFVVPLCKRDAFIMQGFLNIGSVKEVSPVRMYGTRPDKNNEVVERLVPADRTMVFRMRWGTADVMQGKLTQCDVIFRVSPRPGDQLQAVYNFTGDACDVTMYKLEPASATGYSMTAIGKENLPDYDKETFAACGEKGRRAFMP